VIKVKIKIKIKIKVSHRDRWASPGTKM